MRATLLAILAFGILTAPAQARCAPGPDDTVIARTPAGTLAYQTPRERIFACRRGGEPVRIGKVPFFGDHAVRVAGGFAVISVTHCEKYDGNCFDTVIKVWNLRRGKVSYARDFSIGSDLGFGAVVDLELCANGSLATLLRVGANLEYWSSSRSHLVRHEADPGREGHLRSEGTAVWAVRDGVRSDAGYGICSRR